MHKDWLTEQFVELKKHLVRSLERLMYQERLLMSAFSILDLLVEMT
jgi:hypothetical protein